MVAKLKQFVLDDIWRIRAKDLPRGKSIGIRALRILILSVRQFQQDNCQLRASALTFFTLLSIVPVFAMAFGVAKGFGLEKKLQAQLMDQAQGQQEVFARIIEFSQAMLENTKGGIVAGIGIAVLFWSIIKMMGHIESAFNRIWGVRIPRTLGRKFTDYLSFLLIAPVVMIMSSSMTVFVTSQITQITEKISLLGVFSPIILFGVKFIPYMVLWAFFTFLYVYMPNTKVKLSSGIVAGIIAGTTYQLVQWAYIKFQIGVASYNAIYGSFAALPLFLMWLQISWLVVLFGAEIAFSNQNVDTFEFEPDCLKASYAFKRLVALRIVHICAAQFEKGDPPLTDNQIADRLEVPVRLVRQLLFDLTSSRLLSQVKVPEDDKKVAYQPARSVSELTIRQILNNLEHNGVDVIPVTESDEFRELEKKLNQLEEEMESSSSNVPITSI